MQLRVQHHPPASLLQERTRYPLNTTLAGSRVSQGDSNKRTLSCPAWILNRTFQPAANSLYRLWHPRSLSPCEGSNNKRNWWDARSNKFSAILNPVISASLCISVANWSLPTCLTVPLCGLNTIRGCGLACCCLSPSWRLAHVYRNNQRSVNIRRMTVLTKLGGWGEGAVRWLQTDVTSALRAVMFEKAKSVRI